MVSCMVFGYMQQKILCLRIKANRGRKEERRKLQHIVCAMNEFAIGFCVNCVHTREKVRDMNRPYNRNICATVKMNFNSFIFFQTGSIVS